MSKVIVFNMITLDGFFEGPNREIDWHNVDEEFNDFAINQLNTVGTLIFGRVTYQLMAGYWPMPTSVRDDPIVAGLMNNIPKIVFSRTLETADWNNTRLVKGDMVQEVARLRQQPGKDIYIFGSGSLVSALGQHGLIDEYRVIVNPVILGKGNSMFKGLQDRLKLKLVRTRTFNSGNVLLVYEPLTGHASRT
jgi:dihydrofolate reductase